MTLSKGRYPLLSMLASLMLATLVAGCVGQTSSGTSSATPDTSSSDANQTNGANQTTTNTVSDDVAAGNYECSTFTDGHLEARAGENFTIVDAQTYRDASGGSGGYTVGGDLITFQGGALDGKQAMYTPGTIHTSNPPSIAILMPDGNPGDTCQPQ
jgi:hypothetical protein